MTREFMIQRYSSYMWPWVRGLKPFIVTGPSFTQWVNPRSLELTGQWKCNERMSQLVADLDSLDRETALIAISIAFLELGIVQALWSTDRPECLSEPVRYQAAINQLAAELRGYSVDVLEDVFEFASGLLSPAGARAIFTEDALTLSETVIPQGV